MYYCDGMTMEEPETTGRKPRVGESGAPVGSVLSIVLAVVAVVIGFVILKQINDDSESAADGNGGGGLPAAPNADGNGDNEDNQPPDSTQPQATTTTEPAFQPVFKGASVVVANGNGGPGAAGDMSDKLEALSFTMGEATDAANTDTAKSVVYYVDGNAKARAVAETVARSFGQKAVPVQKMPGQVPTSSGEIDGEVLFLYGQDLVDVTPKAPAEG